MKTQKQEILIASGLVLAGLFTGWLLFGGASGQDSHPDHEPLSQEEMNQHIQEAHTDDAGDIIYTCSMHPQVRESEPGNCPICGMDLIPARTGTSETGEDSYSMVMTEAAMRLAEIQTTPAIHRVPEKELDLPGRIQVDESRITRVTTHFPGRVITTDVDFTGAEVRKGEPMASIYSPELISAQRELIEAVGQKERNPRLYESARQKFRLWEFTDEQIDEIENHGRVRRELEILSPADGFVLSRNIADQQHVTEGTVIYEVADLDHVWVVLEAYEEDINWIRTGDTLTFRGSVQSREATVTYIDPIVDPQKRTVGIRADIENPGHRLKPDMLVRGLLRSRMDSVKLMVPASSVLWTGPRSLVYVKDTSSDVPRFEVREVELGIRAGDFYTIEEGISEGEEVVFHGAFRIDSEMQLADRFSMMNRKPGSGAVPVHDHGGMDMGETDDPVRRDNGLDDHEGHGEQVFNGSGDPLGGITEDFQNDFRDLLLYYLDGKEALFASGDEEIRQAFQNALDELEAMGVHRMDEEAHMRWIEHYEAVEDHLNHILNADDIAGQREGFETLSQVMIEAVHSYDIPGVLFHQYCPMEEANWLSRTEEIENPYTPDSMPNCGEVIEKLE